MKRYSGEGRGRERERHISIALVLLLAGAALTMPCCGSWTVGSGGDSWSSNVMMNDTIEYGGNIEILNVRARVASVNATGYNPANLFAAKGANYFVLGSSTTKVDLRFTAQESKTVTKVRIYLNWVYGSSTTYRVGLQDDSAGDPDGSFDGSGTFTPSEGPGDWHEITLNSPVAITTGTVYHIVIEHVSGPINETNYIEIKEIAPANTYIPLNKGADHDVNDNDTNLMARHSSDNGSSWHDAELYKTPVFLLVYSDGTYGGQPYYDTGSGDYIYDAEYGGGQVLITGSNKTVSTIGFFVKKRGSPAGALEYEIKDGDNNVLRNGTLATAAEVGTAPAWIDANLSSNLTLNNGSSYKVILKSPNSVNSSNCYQIYTLWVTDLAEYKNESYGGTNSWSSSDRSDIPFRLKLTEVFSGNLTSIEKDAESIGTFGDVWKNISFSGSIPDGTVSIYVNTSSDSVSWTGWTLVNGSASSGATYNLNPGNQRRYGKWRLQLQTSDTSKTPEIYSVTIGGASRYITSCDSGGNITDQFAPNESVYVKAVGLVADTNYTVWIQDNIVSEGDTLNTTEDPSDSQELVKTDANGNISVTLIWAIPSDATVTHHEYDIVFDKQDDGVNTGKYHAASDAIDSATVAGIVAPVPEAPTFILFGSGLILIYFISRRKKEEVKW